MAVTTPYLNFDGKCREAMQFYKDCLGGELTIMTFGDVDPTTAADAKDRVMHGRTMMEPQDTFWNAHFAMFSDKFGFNWMLNHDKAPAA